MPASFATISRKTFERPATPIISTTDYAKPASRVGWAKARCSISRVGKIVHAVARPKGRSRPSSRAMDGRKRPDGPRGDGTANDFAHLTALLRVSEPSRRAFPSPRQSTCSLCHGTQTTACAFYRRDASSISGGCYALQVFGHCRRARCDAGGHGGMGAKHDERTDTRSHHAKDAAGAEHRTGGIRIRARPPQAQIPLEISISIHAEPSNDAIDHRHARALGYECAQGGSTGASY